MSGGAHGGTGWSWSFFPRRLRACDAFLELDRVDRGVLQDLYASADKWGRGPGDKIALMQCLAIMDGFDARPSVDRIAAVGLVISYVVKGCRYWQIVDYRKDAPGELRRKTNGKSTYPPPPGWADDAEPDEADDVRTPSGKVGGSSGHHPDGKPVHPDTIRTPSGKTASKSATDETRRDETREPTLRSALHPPYRADDGEPRPAAATVARAHEDPDAAPQPPALEGAGGAPEHRRDEPQPVPEPTKPTPPARATVIDPVLGEVDEATAAAAERGRRLIAERKAARAAGTYVEPDYGEPVPAQVVAPEPNLEPPEAPPPDDVPEYDGTPEFEPDWDEIDRESQARMAAHADGGRE
jgi:hypothetical protein